MKYSLVILLAIAAVCLAKPKQIIIEHSTPSASDSTPPQMTIDPTEMLYQAKVDSLNEVMEQQIQAAIERLECGFDDPKTEEEIGRIIGMIVIEQQLALLDIEIDRALSFRDTLLLKGLELGLQELLRKSPEVRETLRQQIKALEQKFGEGGNR